MLNMKNEELYESEEVESGKLQRSIGFEELKAIFYECKIK